MMINTFFNKVPETVIITPYDFVDIEDNPRQRDTKKQAARACRRHLKSGHISHCKVNIARLPSGKLYKLDGHSRCLLWEQGRLSAPEFLSADIWDCKNISEVESLYLTFDNRDAAEQNNMLLFGTLRSKGLEIKSGLLKRQGMFAALQHIYGTTLDVALDTPESIIPSLAIIDGRNISGSKINTGVLSAMIATVYKDGDDAMDFWEMHINDEGVKNGKKWDGVYGIKVVLEKTPTINGREIMRMIMRRSLSCYTAYKNGRLLMKNASEMPLTKFVPDGLDY